MIAKRKGLFIILDGLGDGGIESYGGQTPLEQARTPNMDRLIQKGQGGLMDPLFPGVPVGTHTGTGVLLGIPPGMITCLERGPIEAAGIGIHTEPGDILIRCNFATLEANDEGFRIFDRRAGRIKEHTLELTQVLQDVDMGEGIRATLSPATQHRAVLRLSGGNLSSAISDTDPGSGFENQNASLSLAKQTGEAAERTARALNRFMSIAHERLKDHPVNVARRKADLLPANGVLCRSAGLRKNTTSLIGYLGLRAGLVSGESTVLGLGRLLGYQITTDPGFTAMPNTDLKAKFEAARTALEENDILFLHIKGPDICAHDRDYETKKTLLESVDSHLGSMLDSTDNLVVAITGDHSTDSNTGNHTGDPVPSLLSSPISRRDRCTTFGEAECAMGGLGRLTGTSFLCSMLDAMGILRKFKPGDESYYTIAD
ncbi:MAG: 2,3-bisphosphoglycerate-independent phosphoglycerate mutase [Gammaproteobacteria bacterium]|nr:2,3-bisphosphoglycerate-independent phosphoglycerate mutase [Gammaproteobacteria bacterium]